MQVLCKVSTTAGDIFCSVCGQGFLVYCERCTMEEQAEALRSVEQALRNHHASGQDCHAHPQAAFNVPDWDGMPQFSGAALLGNAPKWAA